MGGEQKVQHDQAGHGLRRRGQVCQALGRGAEGLERRQSSHALDPEPFRAGECQPRAWGGLSQANAGRTRVEQAPGRWWQVEPATEHRPEEDHQLLLQVWGPAPTPTGQGEEQETAAKGRTYSILSLAFIFFLVIL